LLLACLIAFPLSASAEWKIDLSRRQKAVRDQEIRSERGPSQASEEKTFFDALFDGGDPMQEIVVLNTDKGFLPSTVRMRKGGKYIVHVVNVNEKDKNISFVLDGFSEHHATFYGKVKSFRLEPKKEGVFSFQCPETSVEGRLVVYSPKGIEPPAPAIRAPASEGK
jgi:hypothetical protein